jgi:hypothetical protein
VLHSVARRQIRGDRTAPLLRLPAERVAVLVADEDLSAFARQQIGDRLVDTVRSGAHVSGLAAQLVIHAVPRPYRLATKIVAFDFSPQRHYRLAYRRREA